MKGKSSPVSNPALTSRFLLQDVRYGFRAMLKTPNFMAATLFALTLGIGANTAIFSVVNAVVLRPLPYSKPEKLVMIWETDPQKGQKVRALPPQDFLELRAENRDFEEIAAFISGADITFDLTGRGEPERIRGAIVSAGLTPLLRVTPLAGRTFSPQEDRPGGDQVVLLSYSLWQRRFGGDPNLLGKTVALSGRIYTIVGILPSWFDFPRGTELWLPGPSRADEFLNLGFHVYPYYRVIGRLRSGVTIRNAQVDMETIAHRLSSMPPSTGTGPGVLLIPLQRDLYGDFRPTLLILFVAVTFVLFIACANVTNLLLARSIVRRKELAVRTALGASRSRLIRQLLTESILLGLLGGMLGLFVSFLLMKPLLLMVPADIALPMKISPDHNVLLFTLGISIFTGLVFGLVPAFQTSKIELNDYLKEESGGKSPDRYHGLRRLSLLVTSEIALTTVLLIGGGLLIKSLLNIIRTHLGIITEGALTMKVDLPAWRYRTDDGKAFFYEEVINRIQGLPGVESVGITSALPLGGGGDQTPMEVEGARESNSGKPALVEWAAVSAGFFRAMGIALKRGRFFARDDSRGARRVAIVDESLARRLWPGEDPIGKRLAIEVAGRKPIWREVVGVLAHVRGYGWAKYEGTEAYVPYAQTSIPVSSMTLVVRSRMSPLGLLPGVRSQIRALDKDLPVSEVQTMPQVVSRSMSQPRFAAVLLSILAALALALATVGVYGVVAYSVTQRTREIGIRVALGASRRDVLSLVVGQGLKLVVLGLSLGLCAALALTRVLSRLLYGVHAVDPTVCVCASLLLGAFAVLASYIPARRASLLDPVVALKCG